MATTTIKKNPQTDINTLSAAIDRLNNENTNQGAALKYNGIASSTINPYTLAPGWYTVSNTSHVTTNHEWPAKNMWGYFIKFSPAGTGTSIGIVLAQGKMYWGCRVPGDDQTKNTWYTVSATESSYN